MPASTQIVAQILKSLKGIPTKRLGEETGIFFGNKVTKNLSKEGGRLSEKLLPTTGADVGYFGPVEHWGNGSGAPVADAVDMGQIPIDKDILQLAKHFSPQDSTWAKDLAGLISLKRSGKEVAHFLSNQDPTAVVSTDLRHVSEQKLLKNFVEMLMTKDKNVPFDEELWKVKR